MAKVQDDILIQVANLMDCLRADDIQLRLRSVRNLSLIADTIGPERTRNELLPYLIDCFNDDDEVLVAYGEEIGKLVPQVGGNGWAHTLLQPLEQLAILEDALVREKALVAICSIIPFMSQSVVESTVFDLVKRLSLGDWITKRTAAPCLYAAIYRACNAKQRDELIQMYSALSRDDSATVRRSAARCMKDLISQVDKVVFKTSLLPILQYISGDELDSIRLWVMNALIASVPLLTPDEVKAQILPIFRRIAEDKSWRVKFKVAELICDFSEKLPPAIVKTEVTPLFVGLMRDGEIEVKTIAAKKLSCFASHLTSETIIKALLPPIKELSKDENTIVKEALAVSVLRMTSLLSRAEFNANILPLLTDFLSEKQPPEVRASAIANLPSLAKNCELEQIIAQLIPAVTSLTVCPIPQPPSTPSSPSPSPLNSSSSASASSSSASSSALSMATSGGVAGTGEWRIRMTVIKYIAYVAKELGQPVFNEKLLGLCVGWMDDDVSDVRVTAVETLASIGAEFGPVWVKEQLAPSVIARSKHKSYIRRLISLFAFSRIAPLCPDDALSSLIFPAVAALCADPVPNVRMKAASTLRTLYNTAKTAEKRREIKQQMEKLLGDPDKDVQYSANKALESL
ncbi:putative protein phosphatase 2A regulatory subunit A [Monocercomonoides exilis]|uniref:putative protein phosphatase 2A regulatory subunit A n=1 Tax=Monocercomonoides exilis TaxID=2049356 RepID=UPI003559808A|nr:putative protein phosphatase 2A regulatory subunit A [Monocercomonoides exilis]|eukprot:MONOS_11221.1-p1 / transcript=MONOS_11221.1 / gene=MONOS_11221 / organism=Monocercomonoides_exilis_PA203 / gene_product=protein phosphatase 2A regulatory subunit A / transcript_product=protein phosphatase 2A regulatory subunit A / location=Mono_scaffold00552:4933-7272(-) / protein_length=628 / sequence_SO=supercontig / SO=protein_coding / is_pseudo=false